MPYRNDYDGRGSPPVAARVGGRDVRFLTTSHSGDRASTGDCPYGFLSVRIIAVGYSPGNA